MNGEREERKREREDKRREEMDGLTGKERSGGGGIINAWRIV